MVVVKGFCAAHLVRVMIDTLKIGLRGFGQSYGKRTYWEQGAGKGASPMQANTPSQELMDFGLPLRVSWMIVG